MTAKYVLGIDLGTTNSVLAYTALDAAEPQVEVLPIPQLVAAGTVESRTMLPSFLYLAHPQEAESGAFDLPWAEGRNFVVGELARWQAAQVPDRTVGAAKSWLAYSRVDRRQPILPWARPAEVLKVSPLTASPRYLEHIIAAWQQAFPDAPAAEQLVVLTVPASFDATPGSLPGKRPWRPDCRRRWCSWKSRRRRSTPGWAGWATAGGGCSAWAISYWCATSAAARPT